ncbi:MAG: NADPH:quinone oxidoreductase family protein [Pseudomonadota bacterium]
MRALVVRQWTEDFNDVKVEDGWPSPELQPGTVRIRTQAVGMSFTMSLRVAGKYQVKPPLPHAPGTDVCGVVTEVAEGVTAIAVGDRVAAWVDYGAFAEECIAPAHRTYKLPPEIPFFQAVTFPTSWSTAYILLAWPEWVNLQPGETILIHGAAGAVGIAAMDIAKILGATVIATCGSNLKAEVCRAHGADHVINYREEDFLQRVREITGGVGANVIIDPVGGDVFHQSLKCLAPEGRIAPIGFASGSVPQIPANFLLMKNAKVLSLNAGYYVGQWGLDPARHRDVSKQYEPRMRHSMEQLFRWTVQGRMKPEISHVFGLDQCHEALAAVSGRDSIGKVAVVLGEEARRLGR